MGNLCFQQIEVHNSELSPQELSFKTQIICVQFNKTVMIESVLIRCTNENINQLQQQLREIGNPDSTTFFKQHVFTLCLTIVPGGRLERVNTKLCLPPFTTLYKNCKLYRLALFIREVARLIAHNYEVFTPGDNEDTLIIYHHPNLLWTLLLALQYRIFHRKANNLLVC